jgi:hypothetical protein
MHRIKIASITVSALVAISGVASGQSYQCKATETQPECHTRLKCHEDEELEDCQKRLRSQRGDKDRDRDDDDRGRDRDRDRDDNDRGRRDRGRDRDDRSRSSRGGGRRGDRGRHRRGGGGGGGGGSHAFEANKTFGLGLELGEPSGLNGKYFFSDKAAFDFGLGWIYRHYYYGNGVHFYGDFLYHPLSIASTDAFELPLYIGVGLRFWDFDYCYMNVCDYHDSAFGLRIPFGIAFDFNRAPLDIFLQLVPVIDFVGDDYYDRYGDRAHGGIDASVGFRLWFK